MEDSAGTGGGGGDGGSGVERGREGMGVVSGGRGWGWGWGEDLGWKRPIGDWRGSVRDEGRSHSGHKWLKLLRMSQFDSVWEAFIVGCGSWVDDGTGEMDDCCGVVDSRRSIKGLATCCLLSRLFPWVSNSWSGRPSHLPPGCGGSASDKGV